MDTSQDQHGKSTKQWNNAWNSLTHNLQESEKLPEPVFTPSTKAEDGLHDENISFTQAADIVGLK